MVVRLLVPFVIALFMAWSPHWREPVTGQDPLNFWPYLPGPYKYTQFTYRLMLFVVIFGALLGGVGLAMWLPAPRVHAGGTGTGACGRS